MSPDQLQPGDVVEFVPLHHKTPIKALLTGSPEIVWGDWRLPARRWMKSSQRFSHNAYWFAQEPNTAITKVEVA